MALDNKTKIGASSQRNTFEQFLVNEGMVPVRTMAEIQRVQVQDKKSLDEAILGAKALTEEELTQARAKFFHLPYVDLNGLTLPKEIFSVFARETMENYHFFPFAKQKNVVKVALTDPSDLRALEALEFLARQYDYRIELYLTSRAGLKAALDKGRNISTEVGEALSVMKQREQEKAAAVLGKKPKEQEVERKITPDAPIIKIVDVMIKHAITARASDIHVEPQEKELRIRYRIDGVLHSSLVVPKVVHQGIVSRIKILSNLKIDEQRLPQDGRFHMDVENRSIDFRISTLPTVNGEKVVMRILDKSGGVPTFEDLGLSGLKLDRLKENIGKAHGMFLVTGPTGSGKSTTLYSVLNVLNKIGVNIVTLEDPVEYFISGINQSQINPDIGLTFASGLRSILRQDPNIIMVGEIRDKETAELAVHSALTGHLVFSTLHTNDAIGAIPRLLDMGIEAFLLTASINAVMAQRLVRKICAHCKGEVQIPSDLKKTFIDKLQNIPAGESQSIDLQKMKMFKGKGCKICGESGYQGRVAIYEVMAISEKIKNLMLESGSIAKIRDQAVAEGMIFMEQDGLIKVLKGVTTIEEVIRVTKE